MNQTIDENKFLEKFKKKVIKECLKSVYSKYRVVNDDGYDIDIEDLNEALFTPLLKTKRCIGTTNSSPISQCSRNALTDSDYCKKHMFNIGLQSDKNDVSFYVKKRKPETVCESSLTKKFIEDTFYYIDNQYVYDLNLEKVGYMDDGNCVLTSDPFILEMIY